MKKISTFLIAGLITLFPQLGLALLTPSNNPGSTLFVDTSKISSVPGAILFVLMNILLPLAGLVAVLFLIIGGYQYMVGGEEGAEHGKKTVTSAIIGIVIIVLSYVLVTVIGNAIDNKIL